MSVKSFTRKKVILWDWNGTLLDDADICVACMNRLLEKRQLRLLDKERYREIFTFPVKEYYEMAGFDFRKEDFEIPAMEFIRLYHVHLKEAALFPCVEDVLQTFKNLGFYQVILSAMEHDSLVVSLKDKGVYHFFDRVAGIDDHYAHSKLEMGKKLIETLNFDPEEMLFIGDSLHDLEVSGALGVDCILVANGHQAKERLLAATPRVVDKLSDVLKLVGDQ